VSVLHVRGYGLPTGEVVDLYADGDQWTTDPVADADLAGEGWVLPGLVDAHTHPGAGEPGTPFDEQLLRADLRQHAAAGVTLIRSPGLAGQPPDWFGADPDLPRAVHAGPWFTQDGQFFDGWGRRPSHAELPALAAEQARRTGWAKIIGDWRRDNEPIPADVLAAVVTAVHAAGGRVAVHANYAQTSKSAVAAGVDSIEHGMRLDPDLLPQLATDGIALTPTLSVIEAMLANAGNRDLGDLAAAVQAHRDLVVQAAEAGVTLLAGTDSRPHGRITDEISALVAAGLRPVDALAAASWVARSYLGWAGLEPGAPADAVVYDADPRSDLSQLASPAAVILRGKLVYRRA
jgi:imidazolonepropionase-like amidohydrolase